MNYFKGKTWIFISPEGEIYKFKGGFKKFCKEHGLSEKKMREIAHFRCAERKYKGWEVWLMDDYYNEDDNLWNKTIENNK